MALKLGKCRLCLKLGDFYSIFTVDNSLQLAEMAMECAKIKIYEGDGLPDKVCAECIQKLSSAHIFKQQCERSDVQLRSNYVPPPGFSVSLPPNRQSSDSGFSTRTDVSNQAKLNSSFDEKPTPSSSRPHKRSQGSDDHLFGNKTPDALPYKTSNSKYSQHEVTSVKKRPRLSDNISAKDFDYEDNSTSQYSGETDSDDPLVHKCGICDKELPTKKSLTYHMRYHSRTKNAKPAPTLGQNAVVDIPPTYASAPAEDEEKQSCDKCGKTFKLKIMLKRHKDVCVGQHTQKELKVSLENVMPAGNKIDCALCTTKFKTVENLEKHMRVVHAAVHKKETPSECQITPVPCVFCHKPFDDYYVHVAHFNTCTNRSNVQTYVCLVCRRQFGNKSNYFSHIKEAHLQPQSLRSEHDSAHTSEEQESFQCRMCSKKLGSQDLLIQHLAAHMSNVDSGEAASTCGDESRDSIMDDSHSQISDKSTTLSSSLKCQYCDKLFTYKKSLTNHLAKHLSGEIEIKAEPPDLGTQSPQVSEESSGEDDENTCDICEKHFSYKKHLIQHKRTKHNMSSGTKRASVVLKNCLVKCLICDVTMKVSESNQHNQIHLAANIKPRNLYTCAECNDTFKSCSSLGDHIKLVHRLKRQVTKKFAVTDLADFCEVVVTKTEPLDTFQSHNDFGAVPGTSVDGVKAVVNLTGFTCPICSKKMGTLISLKRHVNWHTNVGNNIESKHECFICNMTFKFNCHFRLHMREHYNDTNLDAKYLTCTICNRKSKHLRAAQMHMKYHNQTRFNVKDYQCSICKRVFQYRKVYLSHMAIHYKRGESVLNTVVGDTTFSNGTVPNREANQCPHCGKVCDSETSLKCHISWHKSKSSLYGARYECGFCKLQFTNKRRQELHIRTHYEDDNGPYKCNICQKGFTDEDYFRRHVKGHNFDHQSHKKRIEKLRMNKVKCPICTRYYPDLVKLIRHLRRTHPESKMIKTDPDAPPPQLFPCKLCAKVFESEVRLQHHEKSHLRKHQFYACKFCGRKSMSLKNHNVHIKGHLTMKHVDNPLKCTQCEATFVRGYSLHHHLRDVHGIHETWIADGGDAAHANSLQDLQCAVCHKVLASKGNYERHIDYHNLLRCNYCFDYFGSLKFLEGHLAYSCAKKKLIGDTEVYPKRVKCHICYKAFHIQVKLDCHLSTQHGIRVDKESYVKRQEIVCDFCFRVFENEESLNAHKLYHRTVGYYGCLYCNRKFNTLVVYRKHKTHHFSQLNVENPTKCEHCDETFVAFREMIYHMRDVHNDDKEWVVMPKESIEEKCHICNKTFYNLQRHIQLHEENRCKKCGEYFMSRIDYDNHLCTIESDEEPDTKENDIRPKYEECNFCFKPITKANSKLKHDLIHKGSGSISCRFCALKFKTIDAFNIHAFSHRSRKYNKNPLKCPKCNERFVKYGPFMKHMRNVHKISEKMHYRTVVLPERCVVCGEKFPNLHNHYRAHLQNRCQLCLKYFTSSKLFDAHRCDKEDAEPSKVFTCDENLIAHINSYVPKDEVDDKKYYGNTKDDEEREVTAPQVNEDGNVNSYNEMIMMPLSIQSPIISDVLSLYEEHSKTGNKLVLEPTTADNEDVVQILDDNSVDSETVIIVDDD